MTAEVGAQEGPGQYKARAIPLPTDYSNAEAYRINDCGDVCGALEYDPSSEQRAFIWLSGATDYGNASLPSGFLDLTDASGATVGEAHDIGTQGVVVGWQMVGAERRAFIWDLRSYDPNNTAAWIFNLGVSSDTGPGSDNSEAHGVTDDEDPYVVGWTTNGYCYPQPHPQPNPVETQAFYVQYTGTAPTKYTLHGGTDSANDGYAHDVKIVTGVGPTAAGTSTACGPSIKAGCTFRNDAVAWPDITSLPQTIELDGYETLWPVLCIDFDEGTQACLEYELYPSAIVHELNTQGEMVGEAQFDVGTDGNNSCEPHATYWADTGTPPVDLNATLPTGHSSFAYGLQTTSAKQIVGEDDFAGAAVLWYESAGVLTPYYLNELLSTNGTAFELCQWEFVVARDINERGQIIGQGQLGPTGSQETVAFILTPEELCSKTGDLVGTGSDCPDGVVNVFDQLYLQGEWGNCADCEDCPADLTGDCIVNTFDLLALLGQWGADCIGCAGTESFSMTGGGGTTSLTDPEALDVIVQAVLISEGFDDWDEVSQWMLTADDADIQAFVNTVLNSVP